MKNKLTHFLAVTIWAMLATAPTFAADPVKLAENGRALATVEVAPTASVATRSVAQEMAGYLERIVGTPFKVADTPVRRLQN